MLVLVALLGTWVVGGGAVATPPLIAAAALLPPLAWAGVVLLLDRRAREPWLPLAAAFLWGAAAAALIAAEVNDALLATGLDHVVPTLLGPAVEEVAKASALLVVMAVWRGVIEDPLDGIVYGALAGLGFAATENLGYYTLAAIQGGTPGLGRALWLRGFLQGLNHAAFTATAGAAVGWAYGRATERPARGAVVAVGLGLAILVHAVWNTVASQTITTLLCGAPMPGGVCMPAPAPLDLLVTVPIVVATFVGPLALCLFAIATRAVRAR